MRAGETDALPRNSETSCETFHPTINMGGRHVDHARAGRHVSRLLLDPYCTMHQVSIRYIRATWMAVIAKTSHECTLLNSHDSLIRIVLNWTIAWIQIMKVDFCGPELIFIFVMLFVIKVLAARLFWDHFWIALVEAHPSGSMGLIGKNSAAPAAGSWDTVVDTRSRNHCTYTAGSCTSHLTCRPAHVIFNRTIHECSIHKYELFETKIQRWCSLVCFDLLLTFWNATKKFYSDHAADLCWLCPPRGGTIFLFSLFFQW